MVSTTWVAGLFVAVFTVVNCPLPAFRPILRVAIQITSFPGLAPRRWQASLGSDSAKRG